MVSLPPETVLDAFMIVRVLGEGGFGVTYLAEDRALGRMVAIKEYFPQSWASRDHRDSVSISPNSSSQGEYQWGLSRFIDEAKTLARFRHPAIVRVSRIIEANNTAYMVLDYEEGQAFGDWLKALGRPPAQAELDAIVAPLLDALSLIHRNHILHRDIAPDNIYIRTDGSPVLLDFGSARESFGQRSAVSAIVKAGYSPLEQYTTDGRDQGPWTDIYALAATLYEAVTGAQPPDAMGRAIEDDYVPVALAAKGSYRPSFLAAIDHAMRCHHAQRPQRIRAWRRELFAATAPAAATRRASEPTDDRRTRRLAEAGKRGGARAGAGGWKWAAALLAAVLIGGGGYYASAVEPAQQDRAAQDETQPQSDLTASLRDNTVWLAAERANTPAAYRDYLAAYPQGRHAAEARKQIAALEARPTDSGSRAQDAKAKLEQGLAFQRDRQYERAIAAYDEAIRLQPKLAAAYNGRGVVHGIQRRHARAIADFNQAIALDPNFARAYYNRGVAQERERRHDAAIADFTKAIELDPNYAKAHNQRGIAYGRQGQHDRAIADFDRAIALDANFARAYYNRGVGHGLKRQYERAIADYDKAIALEPDYASAYKNRALAHERTGRRDKAIADFRKVVELRPGDRAATSGLRRLGGAS